MGLIHHIPLNVNFPSYKNLGTLSDSVIATDITESTDLGILGYGYIFNTSGTSNVIVNNSYKLTKNMSFSCWVYFNTLKNCFIIDMRNSSGQGFQPMYYGGASGIQFYSTGTTTGGYLSLGGALIAKKWYHIAVSMKNGVCSAYLNGVYKSSITVSVPDISAPPITIGARYNKVASTAFDGMIQDVRVYDHALSKKEVYDLSKGLLLHYDFEIGNNLACIKGQTYAVEDTAHVLWEGVPVLKLSQSGNTSTVYRGFSQTLYGLKAGDVVTLSAWIYTENKAGFDSGSEFRIYQTHTDGSANNWAGISWLSSQVDGKWCFHKKTYTMDSTLNQAVLNFNVVKNGTYWVTGIKVEYGDTTTPYSPTLQAPGSTNIGYAKGSSTDTVGYLDPIMDVSGNNIETTSNQIKIEGTNSIGYRAASFNGVYSFVKMNNFKKQLPNEPYTIAFWVYPRDDKTRDVYFGNHNNSTQTFNIERNASNYLRVYYNADTAIGSISTFTIPGSVWTHVAITFDGTTFYAYKNGTQVYSKALSTKLNCTNTTYKIGSDYRTAEGSVESSGTRLNGLMSDFRVYATALSSTDIKSLYESRKTIDRLGNIKAPVIHEDDSLKTSQVLSNGVQKTPYISEIVELDDGSKWIQIMHHDNKNAKNLFSSGDAVLTKSVFKNSDCWCDFQLINEIGLYDSKYEFFLVQEKYNGKFTRYRWSQTVNPFSATFNNTKYNSSGITRIENMPSTYGGMYKSATGRTFFNMNNNTNGNWYGAIACYTSWSQTVSNVSYVGTPGIADSDSAVAVGVIDLWMRIDPANAKYRELRGGVVLTNRIYEE